MVARASYTQRAMDVDVEQLIAQTRNNRAARKLANKAVNDSVKNTNGAFYYKDARGAWQLCSGSTGRLKTVFYPDVDMKAIMKRPKRVKTGRAGALRKPPGKGRHYGAIRGGETHRQMQDLVELNKSAFLKRNPQTHEYTRRLALFITERMGWRPMYSEFAVAVPALGLATAVDMVCLTPQGKLVFLEFKTGYSDYYDNSSGYMHGSLSDLTNSPHNQANLQLLWGVMMVQIRHGIRSDELEMYVIRVDDAELSPHKLNNDFLLRRANGIYRDLEMQNAR